MATNSNILCIRIPCVKRMLQIVTVKVKLVTGKEPDRESLK